MLVFAGNSRRKTKTDLQGVSNEPEWNVAGMRDLCMHLASTADNACDDDEAEQSRGCASPVELVLAGRVAVGGGTT